MNRQELARYKYYAIRHRLDEREKGNWITTRSGHKIFVSENGEVTKGNPIVLSYIKSDEYKRYKIRLGKTEETKLIKSITDNYEKYKDHIGELCGHSMNNKHYLFFNIKEGEYIPLHKVESDKSFENKVEIKRVVKNALKTAEIVSNFTDMIKADTDVKEIKKLKTSEEYFEFVKGAKQ